MPRSGDMTYGWAVSTKGNYAASLIYVTEFEPDGSLDFTNRHQLPGALVYSFAGWFLGDRFAVGRRGHADLRRAEFCG